MTPSLNSSNISAALPSDFPEWMDSMLVKEFRQALRQRLFILPFVFVHLLMLGALSLEWQGLQEDQSHRWYYNSAFWIVAYAVVGFIMPLRGFAAMQEESSGRNAEALLMAGLSRWRIVRGKWLVQAGLAVLVLVSLLPYLIVRYFFGAFDFWTNLIQLITVFTCCLANSALIIGASGYANYTVRILITAISLCYTFATSVAMTVAMTKEPIQGAVGMQLVLFVLSILYGLGFMLINAMLGLQLARAHLKLFLVPWEPSPTSTMATLVITMPFILGAGTVATCGYGGPLVEVVILFSTLMYDRDAGRGRSDGTSAKPQLAVDEVSGENVPAFDSVVTLVTAVGRRN